MSTTAWWHRRKQARTRGDEEMREAVGQLPEPHPAMPRATARRGTRRMPRAVRALLRGSLAHERAASLIRSGGLNPARCSVIWNVGGLAVIQPAGDMSIPQSLDLLPVRRIGTYKGAANSIAMYPVMRDGYVIMLPVESLLELDHLTRLSFDPRITALYAQPCAMVWTHREGKLHHVPDLAAVIDGRLQLFDVKHDEHQSDTWVRLVLDLTAETCRLAGVPFTVLGDVTPEMPTNLLQVSRYRWPNPFVATDCAAVVQAQPQTVGGACTTVDSLRGTSSGEVDGCDLSLTALRYGQQVVKHLLATSQCWADLDRPLGLGTELTWPGQDHDGGCLA